MIRCSNIVRSIFVGTACTLMGGEVANSQALQLNLASAYPQQALISVAAQEFADRLKQETGGKITIVTNFGGALGYSSREQYDAIEQGALHLAQYSFDNLLGLDPIYALHSLPFVSPSIDGTYAIYKKAFPFYENVFVKANQKLLFAAAWTPVGVWAKKPIHSVDDLKGLKIRTVDPVTTESFRRVGARPVQLAWGDVLSSLGTGVIDALVTSDESGVVAKVWEFGINHFTALNSTTGVAPVVMNLDVYKKLSPELQKAVHKVAAEVEARAWERSKAQVQKNRATLEANGGVVLDSAPESVIVALRAAGSSAIEKWKTDVGPEAAKILDNTK